jgi:hypothetical protein
MSYAPTGRPPGRPRKEAAVNPPKPLKIPPSVEPKPVQPIYTGPKPVNVVPENAAGDRVGPFPICLECHPDGWPEKATGLACPHGIWSRPWMP